MAQPNLSDAPTKPVTIIDIRTASRFVYRIHSRDENWTETRQDPKYLEWENTIAAGKSYLVGESQTMKKFLATHTSPLTDWQQLSYQWAIQNPHSTLYLDSNSPRRSYTIYQEGDHVIIALPHQDAGGEKHWASKDGKTKVLINVD